MGWPLASEAPTARVVGREAGTCRHSHPSLPVGIHILRFNQLAPADIDEMRSRRPPPLVYFQITRRETSLQLSLSHGVRLPALLRPMCGTLQTRQLSPL